MQWLKYVNAITCVLYFSKGNVGGGCVIIRKEKSLEKASQYTVGTVGQLFYDRYRAYLFLVGT